MRRRMIVVGLGALLVVAIVALLALLGWPADRYRHNDFAGFWSGSRLLLEGRDPYDLPTWLAFHDRIGSEGREIVPKGSAFGYPLTTALLFTPFALFPISQAAPLWIVAQVALATGALVAFGRSVLGPTARRDIPLLIAFAASSQPAWVLAEGGNLGGFLLAIVAGALTLLRSGRPVLAGAALGLLMIKPHPFLVFVPVLLLVLARPVAIRVAAGGLAVAGAALAVSLALQPGWIAEWLVPVGRLQAAPVGRANAYGLAPADARWLGGLIVLVLAALLLLWWRRRRPDATCVAAMAIPLSLVAAPYGWSYDQLVVFVSAAVGILLVAPLGPTARLRGLVLLILVTVALPWVLYVLAFSNGEEAWSALAPIALILTLLVLDRAVRGPAPRAPVAV